MKFEFFISSTAITVIASLVSGIISALIAKKTAENTANKEIEKIKLSWAHEDTVSSDEEFAEMATAVAKVIDFYCLNNQQDAIGRVAAVRSKEHGNLGKSLDELYKSLKDEDFPLANFYLSEAISQKRSMKSNPCPNDCKIQLK